MRTKQMFILLLVSTAFVAGMLFFMIKVGEEKGRAAAAAQLHEVYEQGYRDACYVFSADTAACDTLIIPRKGARNYGN